MKSLWRYVLVILVSVKCVASQCIGSETCDCHCNCCSNCFGYYCTSCAKGWSGTTSNRCQRQNVAYNTTLGYSSTGATDENNSTYILTKTEENPKLTITLSKIFNIKNIYVYIYAEGDTNYNIYVTKTTSTDLSNENYCASINRTVDDYYGIDISCLTGKILSGDQIVIERITRWGRFQVHDVRVYQCSRGTYGDQCDRECRNCVDNRCNGYTGVCESGCNIGWQGEKCEKNCNSNCKDYTCDQDTGVCTGGCIAGWFGDTCYKQCPREWCESPCDIYLGCTNCRIGYSGSYCSQCVGNTYGKNCSLTCQNCIDCNNVEGCRKCLNGFYGDLCEIECPNQCKNDKCNRQSGNCMDGCKDGHAGAKCETPCKVNCATCNANDLCISCLNGTFGTNCEYRCPETCGGSKTCDKNNGVCSECNPGTFGPNCAHQCSENCLLGTSSVCYKNGTCISGCVGGWFGAQCDKQCSIEYCEKCNLLPSGFSCETCNIGYYLDNAQGIQKCVKCPTKCVSCDSEMRCTQCIPNFTGNQCENECNINCVDGLCELDGTCTYGCNNSKRGVGCTVDCRENCVHCYTGNSCTKCSPGYWGTYCTRNCYKNCFNCTGTYECETCKSGFYGNWCGKNCPSQCLTCDSGNSCTSCTDGLSGRLCQCSENCENGNCDVDGICQSGCKGSYYGKRCDLTCPLKNCQRCDQMSGNCSLCSRGLYGINCIEKCSRSCLGTTCDMTGACLRGCEDGFAGNLCTEFCVRYRIDIWLFSPHWITGSEKTLNDR